MQNYSIKKEVITYVEDHVISFFENGQLLAHSYRSYGVNKLYLFRLLIDKMFNSDVVRVKIRYQYFSSDGEILNGDFNVFLNDIINESVKYTDNNEDIQRVIIGEIYLFLMNENPVLTNYFITDYSTIKELINECKVSIETNTERLAFDKFTPLSSDLFRPYISDDKSNEFQYESKEFQWKRDGKMFRNDDELLLHLFPKLPEYDTADISELKVNLYHNRSYNHLIELDYLHDLMVNENYVLTVKDRVSLYNLECKLTSK